MSNVSLFNKEAKSLNARAELDESTTNDSLFGVSTINITHSRDELLAKVEVGVLAAIFIIAVCGNGLVLAALLLRRQRLSRMNVMIVHLACADLFVAFFNVLPQLAWDITYRFKGPDVLCRSVKYGQVVAMYASSYVLISTALDRWLAICRPLMVHVTWSMTKTHLLVAMAWTLALIFSLPQLIIFGITEIQPGSGVYDCWTHLARPWSSIYATFVAVAIYIIPTVLLVVTYSCICSAVWSSVHARSGANGTQLLLKTKSISHDQATTVTTAPPSRKCSESRSRQSHAVCASPSEIRPLASSTDGGGFSYPSSTFRFTVHRHSGGTLSKAKVKTVKLTLTVVTCYLVCWGPFFVVQLWSVWDMNAQNHINRKFYVIILK